RQGNGVGLAFNRDGYTVKGDDRMQVIHLHDRQEAVGLGGIGALDPVAAACDGDQGRAETVGRAQHAADVLRVFRVVQPDGGIACLRRGQIQIGSGGHNVRAWSIESYASVGTRRQTATS